MAGGDGKKRGKYKVPTILGELNLKVTPKGIVLPESYKTLKQRWRERRAREESAVAGAIQPWQSQAALADMEGQDKRKKKAGKARQSLGVVLDDVGAALFHAAVSGDTTACRAAVAAGADPNVRTNADLDGIGTGGTALHVAASRGHIDVVAALIAAGANATLATGRGEAPIQLATRMGHVEVVKLLTAIGASPMDAEGAHRLLKSAPPWEGRKKRRLMSAVLAPALGEHRGRSGKGGTRDVGDGEGSSEPTHGGNGGGGDGTWVDRGQYWLTGFEDSGYQVAGPALEDGWEGAGHVPQPECVEDGGKGSGRKGRKGRGKGKKGGGLKGRRGG